MEMDRMRIAFFLNNFYEKDIDFSHPENGNPGIRGTEYMIWQIACKLSELLPEVYLFSYYIHSMPESIKAFRCLHEEQALDMAKERKIDILVLRSLSEKRDIFDKIEKSGVTCVMWSHNMETNDLANAIARCDNIKRNVCVSRQQYERLRDHPVFAKSTYIFNGLVTESIPDSPLERNKRNRVTYIGTLEAYKGFHALAHVWPEIRKMVPDAELFVLDSGNRGPLLADMGNEELLTNYEKHILHSLTDGNGRLYPGVHFVGCQRGDSKESYIQQTKVGIANPCCLEEFCITAIEFEAYGVPVVGKKGWGLLDTVCDGETGILIRNERELVKAVVRLLHNDDLCQTMGKKGMKFVRESFDIIPIAEEWKKLLTDVYENIPAKPDYRCTYPLLNYKWLRELSRLWKKTPLGRNSQSVMKLEKR